MAKVRLVEMLGVVNTFKALIHHITAQCEQHAIQGFPKRFADK